ncbi:MAG: DNA translocase FtsK [Spirochaetaceae bacterium]
MQRVSQAVLAGTLFGIGAVLLSSLLAHVLPTGDGFWAALLALPGRVLFESFHAAAFLLPLFFVVFGVSAVRGDVRIYGLLCINLLVLPLLSFALSLRLAFDAAVDAAPVTRWAAEVFTRPGGALIFLTVGALLTVAVIRVSPLQRTEGRSKARGAGRRARAGSMKPPRRIVALLENRVGEGAETARQHPVRKPDWLAGFAEEPEVRMGFGELPEYDEATDAEELEATDPEEQQPDEREVPEFDEQVGEDDDEDELEVVYAAGRFRDPGDHHDPGRSYGHGPGHGHGHRPADDGNARPPRDGERGRYHVPMDGVLDQYHESSYWEIDGETREAAEVLRYTLEEFSIQAEVTGIRKGPVITMFEILPAPGVKLARITNLADNIALRLAASSVRIVAPIPGKHAVGIEIPNKQRHIVSFMELIRQEEFWSTRHDIPLALGKDIPGDVEIVDLTKTPHLLIAGATGSGKSVCVNSIICSILYRRSPVDVKMMLIDPKIVELKFYNDIPHLLTPVITDPKRAFQALQYCIYEMERRYSLLDSLGVRDIGAYNEKIRKRNLATEPLPYIVVVVDELADLMTTSGKELESTLARLAAMSRAVGIHLVLATQRPSTDVITGLIKANIPSRIAFMVSSKVDSRIIIDTGGAEKLLGQGDMLFTSAWDPFPTRMQGAFLSDEEVERVVEHVKTLGEPEYIDEEIFIDDEDEENLQGDLEDPLMEQAIDIVVSANKASASYLQRRLKIGYNRAARLVEEMERLGVVGPQRGSKPRDVLGAPESY